MLVLKKGVTGINVNELNELYKLNGPDESKPLTEAFDWNQTKEGYQFWSFVNSITTTVKEVDKLKEQISVLPDHFQFLVERELEKVKTRNKAKTLRFAFKWGESPQGETYWHMVSELIRYYSERNSTQAVEYKPAINNGLQAQAQQS